MPVDFPTSPTLNQTYSSGGTAWRWNGTAWDLIGGDGAATYVTTNAAQSLANKTLVDPLISLGGTNGSAGQVLTSAGAGQAPVWGTGVPPAVRTPINVSPTNGTTEVGENPALTGSTYYSLYGVSMAASQWQISTQSDFSTLTLNTGDVAGTSLSYSVPNDILNTSTLYYWRVRYKDSDGAYSPWSSPTTFTTAASFGPTTIGQAYGGGYYAGNITDNGVEYYLIVAPLSSGQSSSLQWKTSATSTTGTSSTINGPANSAAMNNADHPAAQFCEGLSIGGYTDWYMPAWYEIEVCYYNLKPDVYPNDTNVGTNPYSVPPRTSNYTSSNPPRTSALIFRTGGGQEFGSSGTLYWTSTQLTSTEARMYYFQDGTIYSISKTNTATVRAVRRIAV